MDLTSIISSMFYITAVRDSRRSPLFAFPPTCWGSVLGAGVYYYNESIGWRVIIRSWTHCNSTLLGILGPSGSISDLLFFSASDEGEGEHGREALIQILIIYGILEDGNIWILWNGWLKIKKINLEGSSYVRIYLFLLIQVMLCQIIRRV